MIEHPYQNLIGGQWMRGNLHTHTTASDGKRPLQMVLDDYAARGYGFLMISDHDILTGPGMYETFDVKGMVLIPGNEITANGTHLLHVNADRRIEPNPLRQRVLNDINSTQGFAIVCHPNASRAFDGCPIAQLQEWVGYRGLEIYNGIATFIPGSPYATNKWDMLLTSGRRLWGFANDDTHYEQDNVGLGWNVAYVTAHTPGAVTDALEAGRFYASTGVVITAIEVDGHKVRIETENAQRIVALHGSGRRFAVVDSKAIEVDVSEADYARFECWGSGETMAWTQPFFVVDDKS